MTTVILPVLGEALPIVVFIAAVVLLGGPFDRVLSRWADAARRQGQRPVRVLPTGAPDAADEWLRRQA